MPSLFVSHGSPMTALEDTPAHRWFKSVGKELPRPKAILIATAHFEYEFPILSGDEKPQMIYDFGGFPKPLYEIVYPAPGEPELARRAARLLHDAGYKTALAKDRGFDHGTWVPLHLMYPGADIPVVQISIESNENSAYHIALGRALEPLRDEGVMIIGSGSLTHNLYELSRSGRKLDMPPLDWVVEFTQWIAEKIETGDEAALADYREKAPHAVRNHPRDEHFLPLPFAFGAGGPGTKGKRIHASYDYGYLAMDAFLFE
ncbi:MAG: dioxygenase [Alphaproteobacteria bacterium]|nr:dioxygenase [Alphaproteobacteria bacterium]